MEPTNMKIGEIREISRIGSIQCNAGIECKLCAFHYPSGCLNANGEAGECTAADREDCTDVYFNLLLEDDTCVD
ncbi:MAG: hypothetical protein ACRC77_05345 [Bacteroidales bacterium]